MGNKVKKTFFLEEHVQISFCVSHAIMMLVGVLISLHSSIN